MIFATSATMLKKISANKDLDSVVEIVVNVVVVVVVKISDVLDI
jgi:hypothetical protein